jgi:hypothetical protein
MSLRGYWQATVRKNLSLRHGQCGALRGAAGVQPSLGSEAGAFKWKLE